MVTSDGSGSFVVIHSFVYSRIGRIALDSYQPGRHHGSIYVGVIPLSLPRSESSDPLREVPTSLTRAGASRPIYHRADGPIPCMPNAMRMVRMGRIMRRTLVRTQYVAMEFGGAHRLTLTPRLLPPLWPG